MNTDRPILSPSRRANRCVLNLLLCAVTVAGVYVALSDDPWPSRVDAAMAAKSAATPGRHASAASAASTAPTVAKADDRLSRVVQLSMVGTISSADSVAKGH